MFLIEFDRSDFALYYNMNYSTKNYIKTGVLCGNQQKIISKVAIENSSHL